MRFIQRFIIKIIVVVLIISNMASSPFNYSVTWYWKGVEKYMCMRMGEVWISTMVLGDKCIFNVLFLL